MFKTLVLVPATDNDGKRFSPAQWRELRDRCIAIAGGFSVQRGYEGYWHNAQGHAFRDRGNAYLIALGDIRQLPAWVALVEWIIVAFRQEAVYVELCGVPNIVPAIPR